jgi:hypothetical protein
MISDIIWRLAELILQGLTSEEALEQVAMECGMEADELQELFL